MVVYCQRDGCHQLWWCFSVVYEIPFWWLKCVHTRPLSRQSPCPGLLAATRSRTVISILLWVIALWSRSSVREDGHQFSVKQLLFVPSVQTFEIDLPKKLVWIESDKDVEVLMDALKKSGKEVKYNGTKWRSAHVRSSWAQMSSAITDAPRVWFLFP